MAYATLPLATGLRYNSNRNIKKQTNIFKGLAVVLVVSDKLRSATADSSTQYFVRTEV